MPLATPHSARSIAGRRYNIPLSPPLPPYTPAAIPPSRSLPPPPGPATPPSARPRRLSPDLRASLASQFRPFCYPPGSHLYESGCSCDEAFILLSGHAMLHVEGRPPQRLQQGAVLGMELMLRGRQAAPLSVTTDPHFETQLAVLSWAQYEAAVRRWAAGRVAELLPRELPPGAAARLRAAVLRGCSYGQRQAGEALYVEGQPVEGLLLLVQGQVRGGGRGGVRGGKGGGQGEGEGGGQGEGEGGGQAGARPTLVQGQMGWGPGQCAGVGQVGVRGRKPCSYGTAPQGAFKPTAPAEKRRKHGCSSSVQPCCAH